MKNLAGALVLLSGLVSACATTTPPHTLAASEKQERKPASALGAHYTIIKCEEPHGFVLDQKNTTKKGRKQFEVDGYTGVRPTFIIRKDVPDLLVHWGASQITPNSIPTNIEHAEFVASSDSHLLAVQTYETGNSWSYVFYTKLALGVFTRYRVSGEAAMFIAKCEI